MKEELLTLFRDHPGIAVAISLGASVLVALLGLVPSVFITAANILYFGFWNGTMISIGGEALGAFISFLIYRGSFKKISQARLQKYPKLNALINAQGREAFWLIFSLRLLPFVPSGLVTWAASVGKISAVLFLLASTLGKIPALLIEAWSVQQVTEFGWQGQLILALAAVYLLYTILKRKKQ